MDAPKLRLALGNHDEIAKQISRKDPMFAGNTAHYIQVGDSALRCVQLALLSIGAADPRRILDLPCGHGRVLRALRAGFPESEITACDLDRDGVDYCAQAFDAVPVYSNENPDTVQFPGSYDLIWCGSLLTHLMLEQWRGFFRLFERSLTSGGVVVFSTHGRKTETWLQTGKTNVGMLTKDAYGISDEQVRTLLNGLARSGFSYVDYSGQRGYGIALSSVSFVVDCVRRFTGLRVVSCLEYGWDEHQDIFACAKALS